LAIAAPFEKELEVFEKHRTEWSRDHHGKYVVIQDSRALDEFFEAYDEAFRAGLREFGVSRNFLVKQIWVKEPIYFVA
jgi:hypothetical protein